jgi:hypothetical protein
MRVLALVFSCRALDLKKEYKTIQKKEDGDIIKREEFGNGMMSE